MSTHINLKSIAILLAVYNGEKYLSEQIDSILSQTNNDWTLYIRDDKSTDNTLEIINGYTSKYDNIVLVEDNDGNLGCRNNFFRLLESVSSRYYMFSDADDIWFNDKIQMTYDQMCQTDKGNNIPIIVHTDYSVTDENLNIIIPEFWKHTNFNPELFSTYNLISIVSPIGGSLMMFNDPLRNLLLPIPQNKLLHDRWIPMVAAKNYAIISAIHVPTKLYRMHGDNFYGINMKKQSNIFVKIFDILKANYTLAEKLRDAGYGSYLKFFFYKSIIVYKKKLK